MSDHSGFVTATELRNISLHANKIRTMSEVAFYRVMDELLAHAELGLLEAYVQTLDYMESIPDDMKADVSLYILNELVGLGFYVKRDKLLNLDVCWTNSRPSLDETEL